ncbi:MAG: alpha/beta fold hydrolase [Spirosomataceae bacterium]
MNTFVKVTFFMTFFFSVLCSCKKEELLSPNIVETQITQAALKLTAYLADKNNKYLIVFESGLGDGHEVWNTLLNDLSSQFDVVSYDRAGYGKSVMNTNTRDIAHLTNDLEVLINQVAKGRKVILVGHSLGGMIIRDYAVKHPAQTAALLFVDASHELYNQPTQADEDKVYAVFKSAYGENFGGTQEARQLLENSNYMATLPKLPNVPVVAITSMKIDADYNAADRQRWYNSKEALKVGLSDFKHITTTKSGHYIMVEEPQLVIANLKSLMNKLP